MTEYTCPKKMLTKKEIDRVRICFKNGDFLQLRKNELIALDLRFYDELIFYGQQYSPVCESGYLKLRIQDGKAKREERVLYDEALYVKNRKRYVEERLTRDAIDHVVLYNSFNWSHTLFGDAYAYPEGPYLFLAFRPNPLYGESGGDCHRAHIGDLATMPFERIYIDFENCEGFDVEWREVEDIHLKYDPQLEWNANGYARQVIGGTIRLRFDPEVWCRKVAVYDAEKIKNQKKQIARLVERLCDKGIDDVDVCHLYVSYSHYYWEESRRERIGVRDMNDLPSDGEEAEEPDETWDDDEDEDYDYDDEPPFVSGYAKKEKDGSVLICFGVRKEEA